MRNAIVAGAFDLFCRKGYTTTTMTEIARSSGTTVANLYVYFDSKLLILYEIYEPWLMRELEKLKHAVKMARTPRTKLRRIFTGIWNDIPAADHSFANSLIEALASAPEKMGKPNSLLARVEAVISALIRETLPEERQTIVRDDLLAHVVWMAFDGFVINHRIGDLRDMDAIAELMVKLLFGE
ncbi:Transcriptional regulator [Paraburkholderia dioscoreae]|uniref:Transcriptional regulator n=2 Tax=Burkholderiaceae TaxID=119060 RepID=A0A5Q4Z788_9BURK|nr:MULTISPECIES: TetR/AcrR family transcriptional regulator [Paraburkholderia]MDR8400711.1 TetR/AcrR family transcriptional regulator [Paraburkholderia sp. USG1]VVD26679.1 Transcriptional regulator [Paraburkholderia dioscoreae]